MIETPSTQTTMIKELRNALPMFAFSQALAKFEKLNHVAGGVITLVLWYSASVLNAVITTEAIGSTARN